MSIILQQINKKRKGKKLLEGLVPTSLTFSSGKNTVVHFNNGQTASSSCLRCNTSPCLFFSKNEVEVLSFTDFPADRDLATCAAGALTLDVNIGVPVIDTDRCILCGVCASRCPVGAIKLVPGYGAVVEDSPNEAFLDSDEFSEKYTAPVIAMFSQLPRDGFLLEESDDTVDDFALRLLKAIKRENDNFPNILIRNLFVVLGVGAAMRRKGNNHLRMDLVLDPPGAAYGVAEVEFGDQAVLDTPRDILDDVAVLVSRYRWETNQIVALIVSDILPNRRSEYWRIIKDINNVLGVKIGTVTLFSLLLMIWHKKNIGEHLNESFYIDCDTNSYREEILEPLIGKKLNLSAELKPHIEVAK